MFNPNGIPNSILMRPQNWNPYNHAHVEDEQSLTFKIHTRTKAHKPIKKSLEIIRVNFIKECEIGGWERE